QISGEERCLITTSPLPDLHDDVLVIVRIFRHQRGLQLLFQTVALALLLLDLLPGIGLHLRIPFVFGQLAGFIHATLRATVGGVELDQVAKLRLLLAQALELLEVGVDSWVAQPLGDRVVSSPNGLELFEYQAAASFSSWRALWVRTFATSSGRPASNALIVLCSAP